MGATLIMTDIVPEKLQLMVDKYGAKAVAPDEIYDVKCDIFAPCALGAVINDDTIPRLKCRIVAGAANNVLLSHVYLPITAGTGYYSHVAVGGGVLEPVTDEARARAVVDRSIQPADPELPGLFTYHPVLDPQRTPRDHSGNLLFDRRAGRVVLGGHLQPGGGGPPDPRGRPDPPAGLLRRRRRPELTAMTVSSRARRGR